MGFGKYRLFGWFELEIQIDQMDLCFLYLQKDC